jgi:hypothetical protein
MELLSIPARSTGDSSTKVLVLEGTTAKFRTAEQIRIDGGGASTSHGATHSSNGGDPVEISQAQVFDTLQLEDGGFLLAEDGSKLSFQGVDDIRDLITALRTVSASDAILGRKSPGSGFFEELTISDALDFIGATARGDIIYRGVDGWERLPAGTSGQFLKTMGTTGDPQWATVTGSGTVTSVSASGSNGVTATVTNQTTTPAISIGLGAITPTSVNGVVLSGTSTPSLAVTGSSSISGSNTGDQTITLTGDVTGTGTGSFAASIGDGKVTYQKIQNVTPLRILGRKSSPAGVVEECTLSEALDFVTSASWGDILYRGQTGWARLAAGTNGQYLKTQGPTANPVWANVSASSTSRRADFCVLDSQGQSGNFNAGVANAYPSDAEYSVFRTEFVPTNFTVSLWCGNGITASAVSGEAGFVLQYNLNPPSSSWTGWQDVPNSTVNVRDKFREFLFTSSTISIPNPPSVVYWRLRVVSTLENSSGGALDATCVTSQITISVWN